MKAQTHTGCNSKWPQLSAVSSVTPLCLLVVRVTHCRHSFVLKDTHLIPRLYPYVHVIYSDLTHENYNSEAP